MSLLNKLLPKKANPAINKIPFYRKALLFISYEKSKSHSFGLQFTISISESGDVDMNHKSPDDPSTIYAELPAISPSCRNNVEKLSYFPSYSEMNPEQRGMYLQWLYDVTTEIDIGYVFVYYYGLERHLVYGDFDAAFDEIQLLRRHHYNGSFQSYSASALVHSCLLRKRIDKLQELYSYEDFDYFGNSNLLMLYYNNLEILPDMMFQLATRLPSVNRRYIKLKPELYKEKISEVLENKFGVARYPLVSRFSLDEVEGISYPIFANISLPPEVRTPLLPNLLRHLGFQNEMETIFKEIHESVKSELKRKPNPSPSPSP
jgi:hypothetical protein